MNPTQTNPFKSDPFARYVGIELLESGSGQARAKLEIKDHHLNGTGVLHGGAIFTLAVWTFAVAANTRQQLSLGLNANITFIHTVKTGTIYAHATEIAAKRKVSTYRVDISNDQHTLLATFQGLAYIKSQNT